MRHYRRGSIQIVALVLALATFAVQGQGSAVDEIAKYRAALQDGNPAELWEARGAALWKDKRGPKNASLEQCDLGLGAGRVKGAYAELPRYFADADRVMDLEARIVWCMVTLQGYTEADAKKGPFGGPDRRGRHGGVCRVRHLESRGIRMNVGQGQKSIEGAGGVPPGRENVLFSRRHARLRVRDVSHVRDAKRIRLQDLPNLTRRRGAQKAYTTWPAYSRIAGRERARSSGG
jgi:sulfur-oxidizing protein SoxA